MTLSVSRPITPGRRGRIAMSRHSLYRGRPIRSLVHSKKTIDGRSNTGRIVVRHRGGGHKRKYRIVDFKRTKDEIVARVVRFEYDPVRSANLALLLYADGERRYIIAPQEMEVGKEVVSGEKVPMKTGNAMPLENILVGSVVHCVELKEGRGAQLARSAGSMAQFQALEGKHALLRLRSGEIRKVNRRCRATLGMVGTAEHNLEKLGKAGARRHRGIRPTVRGVAMNPIDHPHGGGEGKTAGGRHPVSPWGKPTKGYRTASKRSCLNPLIVKRRKK